jgi:UDP-N-acetylglucosamine pyrophosphorylase
MEWTMMAACKTNEAREVTKKQHFLDPTNRKILRFQQTSMPWILHLKLSSTKQQDNTNPHHPHAQENCPVLPNSAARAKY